MNKIIEYPNDILRLKTKDATSHYDVLSIYKNLNEVMIENNGLGIAAPQIGVSLSMFIVSEYFKSNYSIFVNPKIIWKSQKNFYKNEGCLSFPGILNKKIRSAEIIVNAFDINFKNFELYASGLMARCILHEIDHLNGILLID